jgi:hypothetical protein
VRRISKIIVAAATVVLAGAGLSASALAGPLPARQGPAPRSVESDISGNWFNELGSEVSLTATSDGQITGFYDSAVGDASGMYPLTGRFDTAPDSGSGVAIGWTVSWVNSSGNAHSVTTWSGQFVGSQPEITTQWLLTSGTTPSTEWESTLVGHDLFTRTQPSAAQIAQARQIGVTSPAPAHR